MNSIKMTSYSLVFIMVSSLVACAALPISYEDFAKIDDIEHGRLLVEKIERKGMFLSGAIRNVWENPRLKPYEKDELIHGLVKKSIDGVILLDKRYTPEETAYRDAVDDILGSTFIDESEKKGIIQIVARNREHYMDHYSLIREASRRKEYDLVRLFLGWASSQNKKEIVARYLVSENRGYIRRLSGSKNIYSEKERVDKLKQLFKDGLDVNFAIRAYNKRWRDAVPLFDTDSVEVVQLLIDQGVDLLPRNENRGNIFYAHAVSGRRDIVDLMLKYHPSQAWLALGGSAWSCDTLQVESIASRYPHAVNKNNASLPDAILGFRSTIRTRKSEECWRTLKFLLGKGADANMLTTTGHLPLQLAINPQISQKQQEKLVRYLVEHAGADPTLVNKEGETVLEYALIGRHPALVLYLMSIGAEIPLDKRKLYLYHEHKVEMDHRGELESEVIVSVKGQGFLGRVLDGHGRYAARVLVGDKIVASSDEINNISIAEMVRRHKEGKPVSWRSSWGVKDEDMVSTAYIGSRYGDCAAFEYLYQALEPVGSYREGLKDAGIQKMLAECRATQREESTF